MELNIDFDEFKKHLQNRKNAETLLEVNRKIGNSYRISKDIVFEKSKIIVSFCSVTTGGISIDTPIIFEKSKFNNTILVNFNSRKSTIVLGILSTLIFISLLIANLPITLFGYVFILSICPFFWLARYGGKFFVRQGVYKAISKNWRIPKQ